MKKMLEVDKIFGDNVKYIQGEVVKFSHENKLTYRRTHSGVPADEEAKADEGDLTFDYCCICTGTSKLMFYLLLAPINEAI